MKLRIAIAFLGSIAAGPAMASDPVQVILNAAKADCTALDDGAFDARDAVNVVDLIGDGSRNTLIDSSRFTCSSSPSLYCGSGGCAFHAVVDGRTWRLQAEDWKLISWKDRPILLVARDGGWCGGAGAQTCYEAVTWSGGDMLSVMPKPR